VVVLKKERTLQRLRHGKVIRTYTVALGGDPVGAKTRQGDHKTPEGVYAPDSRNEPSQFYKSIHISYPSSRDRAVARQKGIAPGGEVFLNWTDGCVAVSNQEIDEIWMGGDDGTAIEIRP